MAITSLFPGGSVAELAAMFLVVLCRVSALVMTSPGLGEQTSPMQVRAGVALVTTFAILPVVQDKLSLVTGAAIHRPFLIVAIIAGELLCGGLSAGWPS